MKICRGLLGLWAIFASGLLISCNNLVDSPNASTGRSFGHQAVSAFSGLSAAQKNQVRSTKTYFEHASVGANIMSGIHTLAATESINIGGSAAIDLGNADRQVYAAPINAWFSGNSGIADNARGNPGFDNKLTGFSAAINDAMTPLGAVADVAFLKFCWIDNKGNDAGQAAADLQSYQNAITHLQSLFPRVSFVFVTMPLSTEDSCAYQAAFNAALRSWCASHGQWLYDFADIESHDPAGNQNLNGSGNPSIVVAYAADVGHLNDLGQERAAKAWWTMMAAIADSRH